MEYSYQEQQHRQYEQYEQQSHYYREAADSQPSAHDNTQSIHSDPHVTYRYSDQLELSNPTQPPLPLLDKKQIKTPQLQARPSLSLGPLPINQFQMAREQLPTAPSPPIFSSADPEPVYHEQNIGIFEEITTDTVTNSTVINIGSPHLSSERVTQSYANRSRNRNSLQSSYSVGSPVMPERAARPLLPPHETALGPSSSSNVVGQQNGMGVVPLIRSSSDSNWNMTSNSIAAYSTPRSQQSQCYSRQVTLSSIPPNETVPPMPGKIASKTGKIRIQLTFDKPFFNAGGELSGRLEVQCSASSSVMLADMIIELLGYETLAKDQSTPKVFHKTVLRLQDAHRPSQAVQENIEPDSDGYWVARKGRTIFPFRLNIQDKLPNSYESKVGNVRYVTSAIARMKANHQKEIVNHTREVFIYETWTTDDVILARKKSVKADTSKRLFMGGEGSLEMYAELTRTMVSSGGIVYVNVGVKNLTKKKIMGIKLTLWRQISACNPRSTPSSQISLPTNRDQDSAKNYCEIIYKGEDYAFDNDDARMVVLPIYIPSGVYSLRNTTYLNVQFYVQVSLMASMSKNLALELPIYITHASSWSDPPPRIPRDFAFPTHENDPVRKNKTGLFSTKKIPLTQSSGNLNDTKISPGTQEPSRTYRRSFSVPIGHVNIPTPPQGNTNDGACSRPVTRRPSMKDPDSPTSVLNFSQAGNLFVVNPDVASIRRFSASESLMSVPNNASRNPTSPHVFQFVPTAISSVPPPSLSTTPESLPTIAADKKASEIATHIQSIDDSQDFDMSRSVSSAQYNSNKKEQEKLKMGKGLRKTLAKLSISIPNQPFTNPPLKQKSGVSPIWQATTPGSDKGTSQGSSEESPGDVGSPSEVTILSRNSSGSSLKSFKRMIDVVSRKSSVGSTRVMTVSPGPMSPSQSYLGMKNCSPMSSPHIQTTNIGNSSSIEMNESTEKRSPGGQLAMTQIIPDFAFHHGTPILEERGSEGYFDSSGNNSRTPTSISFGNKGATNQSSPSTPTSFTRPWDLQSNFSNSSVTSLLDTLESVQTAIAIRDEYYLSKNNSRRSSYETRIAPALIGDPIVVDTQIYNILLNENGSQTTANLSGLEDNEMGHPSTPVQSELPNDQSQSVNNELSMQKMPYSVPNGSLPEIHYTHRDLPPNNETSNRLVNQSSQNSESSNARIDQRMDIPQHPSIEPSFNDMYRSCPIIPLVGEPTLLPPSSIVRTNSHQEGQCIIPDNVTFHPKQVVEENHQLNVQNPLSMDPAAIVTSDTMFNSSPTINYYLQSGVELSTPINPPVGPSTIETNLLLPSTESTNSNHGTERSANMDSCQPKPSSLTFAPPYNQEYDVHYEYLHLDAQSSSINGKSEVSNDYQSGLNIDGPNVENKAQGYSCDEDDSQPLPGVYEEESIFVIPATQPLTPNINRQKSNEFHNRIEGNDLQKQEFYETIILPPPLESQINISLDSHVAVTSHPKTMHPLDVTHHAVDVSGNSDVTESISTPQLPTPVTPTVNGVKPLMTHVEISTPILDHANPYSNSLYHDTDGISASISNTNEPPSTQQLHPMIGNQAVVRIKGTFRPSPLAFEGNVITAAEPSPTYSSEPSIMSPNIDIDGTDSYSKECMSPAPARSLHHSPITGNIY
ncbi:hypothetical protein BGZ76_007715 [Entomortierella beljakovae]|nr:hypothetical protein BGZ76_007715 [Entomortierella beljakovae]